MNAIAYRSAGPLSNPNALVAVEMEEPTPGPRDLVVRVRGVSVNPVDVKLRAGVAPDGDRVLGFDASGVVTAVGSEVTRLQGGGPTRRWFGRVRRLGAGAFGAR